jgi:transcriptional regulator with XRE-family HTH domain
MQGIGSKIRKHREGQDLSQTALAELCGWKSGNTRISNYEKDDRNVSVAYLFTIADALQISVLELLPDDAIKKIKGPDFSSNFLNEPKGKYETESSENVIKLNRLISELESKGALTNQLTKSLITLLSAHT